MNYEGHHSHNRIAQTLSIVGSVLFIILTYLQIRERLVPPPQPVYLTPTGGAGFGSENSNDPVSPHATRPSPTAVSFDNLTFMATFPAPGQSVANPVRFSWQPEPGVYYAVKIRHTEPDKSYDHTSSWAPGNFYEIDLPDTAIGNLEWCILATRDVSGKDVKYSPWYHFTFDPFYKKKEQQNPNSE